jgi:hypothetical protein
VRVVLGATTGSCWLLIRKDSESGATLYEGILDPGSQLTFSSKRLWIRIGAGENLEVKVNGRRVAAVPPGVANVVATRWGVRRV